jgi:hypothetical protein
LAPSVAFKEVMRQSFSFSFNCFCILRIRLRNLAASKSGSSQRMFFNTSPYHRLDISMHVTCVAFVQPTQCSLGSPDSEITIIECHGIETCNNM